MQCEWHISSNNIRFHTKPVQQVQSCFFHHKYPLQIISFCTRYLLAAVEDVAVLLHKGATRRRIAGDILHAPLLFCHSIFSSCIAIIILKACSFCDGDNLMLFEVRSHPRFVSLHDFVSSYYGDCRNTRWLFLPEICCLIAHGILHTM